MNEKRERKPFVVPNDEGTTWEPNRQRAYRQLGDKNDMNNTTQETQTDGRQAPIFRAKYQMSNTPKEQVGTTDPHRFVRFELANGDIEEVSDRWKSTSGLLDKIGYHYAEVIKQEHEVTEKDDKTFSNELKELCKGLAMEGENFSCDHTAWSYEIKLETPSGVGSSRHIARRKQLESFFKAWNVDFTVECFTVHSDMVCKLA